MAAEDRYEIRGFELYVDGNRFPVSPGVVRAVIYRRMRERGILPLWDRSWRAPIDRSLVDRILTLERVIGITHLEALLKLKKEVA